MAFKITKINDRSNSIDTKEFLCQTPDDVLKLPRNGINGTQDLIDDTVSNAPCAIGSTALVCSTAKVYILAPDNTWIEFGGTK